MSDKTNDTFYEDMKELLDDQFARGLWSKEEYEERLKKIKEGDYPEAE